MKKKFILSLVALCTISAHASSGSHKFQILLNAFADWFTYAANIGGSITNDLTVTTPMGSTVLFNGLIFPKDTVDVETQSSFLVDRYGNPLTPANSIGTWFATGTRLVDFNLFAPVITPGIDIESTHWVLEFKTNEEHGNRVFADVITQALAQFLPGATYQEANGAITGGTNGNEKIRGKVTAKVYASPIFGQGSIIQVKFSEEVEYK